MMIPKSAIVSSLALLLLLVPVACSWPFGPTRATPFPPDLAYIPPDRIKTTMWVLAAEIQHLENLLSGPAGASPAFKQTEVINSLERMRVAAKALDPSGRASQHPILNQNLDRFLVRLERAKREAERDPPGYFQASTVAGSCYLCHGKTQGTARSLGGPETPKS